MANYHQNPSYQQETVPTYQNYGFSPAYDQQHQVPPHPTISEEYLRQPATAPYPTPPPPPQQQPVFSTHVHVQPAAVHVEQQPPRIVYVQQQQEEEEELEGCLEVCCVCAVCICSTLFRLAVRLAAYLLAFFLAVFGLGLAVYFIKYYKK